jgi:hypothetical protein
VERLHDAQRAVRHEVHVAAVGLDDIGFVDAGNLVLLAAAAFVAGRAGAPAGIGAD